MTLLDIHKEEDIAASTTADAAAQVFLLAFKALPVESQQAVIHRLLLSYSEQITHPDIATDTPETGQTVPVVLVATTQAGDVRGFLNAYYAMDWSGQSPEILVRVIRLALQVGAHVAARQLAKLGHESYPDHAILEQLYSIFFSSLPGRWSPARPDVAANMKWMKLHANEYRGQWIALKNGSLLGAARAFSDLIAITGNVKNTGVLVTMIH